ncbi:hypothetical protein GCM10011369_28090 [Neiella marina]|uniref:BioF2-like acetyltransferase domain-containing protein n=1 Tax=Neiella marina TaxID=508461 RepID=A0A8J2XNM8_9GAMM|nr:FemAB family XrtA/PEP-CTERM system-associated protein [Neiella marina]GGA84422.1 hypothetical protein GCM10011369_28090 [Neiella marina]
MTIAISIANEADQPSWDAFVAQHSDASPYHRYAWGQAVQAAYGFTPRYFIAKQNNDIVGVLPTIEFSRPLLKNKLCSLPYCDLGGPLATELSIVQQLLDAAKQHAKKQRFDHLQLRQLSAANQPPATPEQLQGLKVSMRMALAQSAEAQLASFKSKLRSQIRKAEKNGLHSETGNSETLLNHFYEVMLVNMRALGSPVHSYQWFEQIVKHYGSHCLLSVIYKDDIPVGGGLIVKNGTMASIPWASTKAEFNRLAPNMLLYWSLLAHCADNGIELFDFGRSTYGEGTYKFKTQWGATPTPLAWQDFNKGLAVDHSQVTNNTGADSKLSGMVKSWVVGSWQRLPLQMTGSLGPRLRKYIDL